MTYQVLLFGAEAMAAGTKTVDIANDDPAVTTADLKTLLIEAVPAIAGTVPTCRVAVNQTFVADDHKIVATDEIALIGMVSGG
ncbi:MAG: MoaD/ThiS family protein [Acidimicrobiia bacterium]|nr:MoaD/ThiS family protein [Acidimicrobiia bacterium]MDH3471368.1 MoaD/ThiS family protein [Acidimicrobiia bacterium]